MNKYTDRFISVSLLIGILAICKINANEYENKNIYNQNESLNVISSIDSVYERLNMSKEIMSYDSVKRISSLVDDFLGDYYYSDIVTTRNNINSINLYNTNNDKVELSYHMDSNFLVAEYEKDNSRYVIMNNDENNVHIDYYSYDNNDNFCTIDYTNSYETSRGFFLKNNDDVFSISLFNNYSGYYLFFDGEYGHGERMELSADEYILLLSTMSKYNNKEDLTNILKEENFKIYFDRLAIVNPNLYLELLNLDKGKKLTLNVI